MIDLTSAPEAEWLVILDFAGKVAAVDGGAPRTWIGRQYDACTGLPEDVEQTAAALVHESSRSAPISVLRRARLTSPAKPGIAFTLVVVRALFLELAAVEIEGLLRDVLEPMMKQARSMFVSLAFDADMDGPRDVLIDANKIAWALTTLVGSALRHVDKGSPDKPGGHVRVRLRYNPREARVIITVGDDGHGIHAGVRAWLFEPKPSTGVSAGVALRLIDQVVSAHAGRMIVQTPIDLRAGRGTDVTLWLPAGT